MRCALLLLLFTTLAAPGRGQEPGPRLTARILDRGEFEPAVLHAAQGFVAHVFAGAGLDLAWVQCTASGPALGGACETPRGASELSIRMIQHRPQPLDRSHDLEGGFALRLRDWTGLGLVYVYADRVRDVSREAGISEAIALGTVIAHEIGHLLLPGGHSAAGIMRARVGPHEWLDAARGRLGLTPAQCAMLKARPDLRAVDAVSPPGGGGAGSLPADSLSSP